MKSPHKSNTVSSIFWQRVNDFPPFLVRILCHHKWGAPLTANEISERTKGALTPYQIEALSDSMTWKGVDLETFHVFTSACGLDLFDARAIKRAEQYLQRRPSFKGNRKPPQFRYLRLSKDWHTYWKPRLEHLATRMT